MHFATGAVHLGNMLARCMLQRVLWCNAWDLLLVVWKTCFCENAVFVQPIRDDAARRRRGAQPHPGQAAHGSGEHHHADDEERIVRDCRLVSSILCCLRLLCAVVVVRGYCVRLLCTVRARESRGLVASVAERFRDGLRLTLLKAPPLK
jgi:hypothetical protein